jgi:hypothetical protein
MSVSRASMLGLAAAAPAVIGTLAVLAFAAREVSGTTPLSYGPVRNVAEAAGAGQVSEVLRFLRAGEDPAQFWPVRPEIISSAVTRPTGLEAALWGGRQLVEMLDGRGLIRDASTRTHLFCLAQDIGSEEVASYLAPVDAPPCEAGAAFAVVKDRSERATRAPATP